MNGKQPNEISLLAVDTATEACSAALLIGGEVCERFEIAPREHNRLLFEMCGELLEEAGLMPVGLGELDALAFGRGPGAFTGVRIAAAVVQGTAYAHRLPVIAISDLAAIAQQLLDECDEERALAVMDARMGEVYYGLFRRGADGLAEADGAEGVAVPDKVPGLETLPDQSCCIGGGGLAAYPALGERFSVRRPNLLPRAGVMLKLAAAKFKAGETLAPEQAQPVYLRDKVV